MLLFALANLIAHRMALNFLDGRLNAGTLEWFREISSAFDGGGIEAAITMINRHGSAIRGEKTVYNLRAGTGRLLAGNVELPQVDTGFSRLTLPRPESGSLAYKLYRDDLGQYDLTLGVGFNDTDRLTKIVTTSFGWATAIPFGLGVRVRSSLPCGCAGASDAWRVFPMRSVRASLPRGCQCHRMTTRSIIWQRN